MDLPERTRKKWNHLSKNEKAGLSVLIVFFLGVILFFLGTEIGKVFYDVIN